MKYLLLLLFSWSAIGAEIITGTITVTNEAGTTNGQTITVNGDARTWITNATLSSHIATNATIGGSASNMFNAFSRSPFTSLSLARSGTNAVTLQTAPGGSLAVTLSAGWGTISYATNQVTNAFMVRVPHTVEKAEAQTNIMSLLTLAIGADQSTNTVYESSPAFSRFIGNTNAQTVAGIKYFTNATGQWRGIVSNSPAISGTLYGLTNGYLTNATLDGPIIKSNLWFGEQSVSAGIQVSYENGVGPIKFVGESGRIALSVPWADGDPISVDGAVSASFYYGDGAFVTNVSARYVNPGSTVSNLTVNGSTLTGTNTINGQLAFIRKANTALANGNNAAVDISTNVFVEVSGPSAAFVINGIAGGSDGRVIIILNRTGYPMTVANNSGVDATAANRIYTQSGSDVTSPGNCSATFIYSSAASRWNLVNFEASVGTATSDVTISNLTASAFALSTPVWDDVRVPIASLPNPATKPDYAAFIGGTYGYAFDKAADESVYGELQIPHGTSTNNSYGIRMHIHYSGTVATPGANQNVVWGLEYLLAKPGVAFAGATTTIYATNGISSQYLHQIAAFPTITNLSESGVMTFRLFRDADNGADVYDGDAYGLSLDAHIPRIRLGSTAEYGDY